MLAKLHQSGIRKLPMAAGAAALLVGMSLLGSGLAFAQASNQMRGVRAQASEAVDAAAAYAKDRYDEASALLNGIGAEDYYDVDSLAPPTQDGLSPNPDYELRALDPEKEPAKRFVIVDKTYNAESVQARLVAAKRAADLGRHEASLLMYKELRAEQPRDADVLIGYATTLQKMDHNDEAIEVYESLLDIEPDNMDAHINMLGLVGERYPAVALQRLKILEGKSQRFNPALVGQIAYVHARLGRYKDALRAYGSIAARQPTVASHMLNMAIVADKAGMKKQAIKYYEEALQVDSTYSGGRSLNRDQLFDRLAKLRS